VEAAAVNPVDLATRSSGPTSAGFAVELAAMRGLRVAAVAGAADERLVRELGTTWFVPRTARLGEAVRALVPGGVDGALDAAVLGVVALGAVGSGGSFVVVVGAGSRCRCGGRGW
jgi:NADPH:quinone reductase